MSAVQLANRERGQHFRELWARVLNAPASPRLVSVDMFVFLAVALSLRILGADSVWGTVDFQQAPFVLAFILLADGLILFIGNITWNRHVHSHKARMICGGVTIALLGIASSPISFEGNQPISRILIFRVVGGICAFIIFICVLDERYDCQVLAQQLVRDRSRLEKARAQYAQSLAVIKTRIASLTRDRVDAELAQCVQQLRQLRHKAITAPELVNTAEKLRSCAQDVVRELSHSLDQAPERQLSPEPEDEAPPKVQLLRLDAVIDQATLRPFKAGWIAGTVLLPSVGVVSTTRSTPGTLNGILFPIALFIILFTFDKTVGRWIPRLFIWKRVLIATLCLLVTPALAGILVDIARRIEVFPIPFWIATTIGFLFIALVINVALAIFDVRRQYIADLQDINESLAAEADRLHADETQMRRQVARLLHGEVQGRLSAAALQLDALASGIEGKQDINREVIPSRIAMCLEAVEHAEEKIRSLTQDSLSQQVEALDVFASIVSQWQGMISIEIDCPVELELAIVSDPRTREALVETIREATSNAIRHGKAQNLWVKVQPAGSELIVTITDNGIGIREGHSVGMGLRSIGRTARSVSLETGENGGGRLTATFALSATTTNQTASK